MTAVLESAAASRKDGRNLSRARVDELQRTRLVAALIAAVEAADHPEPTVNQIISRARVSRKTFYDLFRDREDCFLAAFDEIFSRAHAIAAEAYALEDSWRGGVRAALSCLLALIDQHPGLAQLCIVHSLGAGERVRLRRDELMAELADMVERGRAARVSKTEPPTMAAELIVGGVHAVIHRRLVRKDKGELHELLGSLMSMIVLPYLGPRAARREHTAAPVSAPPISPTPRRQSEDLLRGLKIRLTYRTVRVLVAIGEQPGASNRDVAEAAGILDQGQVSKLLSRLARLGLIANRGDGHPRGGANAWWLTVDGARLEQATRPRFA